MSEDSNELDQMSEGMADQLRQGPGRGALMRIAREKAGLSVQQLANGMNLSQKQILALEADDLSALPSATFVRGFVRNYARIVGCDPSQFDVSTPLPAEQQQTASQTLTPPAENMPIQSNRYDANRRWMIAAGVVVVIGLVGGYVKWEHIEQARSLLLPKAELNVPSAPRLSAEDQPAPTAAPALESQAPPSASATETPGAAAPLQPASSAASTAALPATPAPPVAPPASASTVSPPKTTAINPAPVSPVATPSPVVSPAPKSISADAEALAAASAPRLDPSLPAFPVVLDLSQDSWVDVREIGGKVFVHGTVKAGEHREFQARGQVKVIIGNAPGVSLSWKGKAVDLSDSTKDSVARLTLEPVNE